MSSKSFHSALAVLLGVAVCASSAGLLSLLLYGRPFKTLAPIVFLGVIGVVSARWGMLAGILGAVVSAIVFATLLYQPIGSLAVADKAARANLAWLILGGLALPYLLAPEKPEHRTRTPRH